ncbi:MAG: hypothetical protein QM765_44535 [Myxococcales bacterium]
MMNSVRTKVMGLVVLAGATTLLIGACPLDDIIPDIGQPSTGKPAAPTFQFVLPTARVDVIAGATINLQWADSHPAGGHD